MKNNHRGLTIRKKVRIVGVRESDIDQRRPNVNHNWAIAVSPIVGVMLVLRWAGIHPAFAIIIAAVVIGLPGG